MKISNKTAASLMQLLLDTVEMQQDDITTLELQLEGLRTDKPEPKAKAASKKPGANWKSTVSPEKETS